MYACVVYCLPTKTVRFVKSTRDHLIKIILFVKEFPKTTDHTKHCQASQKNTTWFIMKWSVHVSAKSFFFFWIKRAVALTFIMWGQGVTYIHVSYDDFNSFCCKFEVSFYCDLSSFIYLIHGLLKCRSEHQIGPNPNSTTSFTSYPSKKLSKALLHDSKISKLLQNYTDLPYDHVLPGQQKHCGHLGHWVAWSVADEEGEGTTADQSYHTRHNYLLRHVGYLHEETNS